MKPPKRDGLTTIGAAIRAAVARLAETSETARLDAELLMAHALGTGRNEMLLKGLDRPLPAAIHPPSVSPDPVQGRASGDTPGSTRLGRLSANGLGDVYEALIARRLAGEPIAYILGYRDFWTIRLAVSPGVLVPRPDTETLIEAAVAHFAGTPGPQRVIDLGTGSGALLLAALAQWPDASGVGIDRSSAALVIASANAASLGMADRARMTEGGWSGTGEPFDLILCNPPYIATSEVLPRDVSEYEPHSALFAGQDGLADYRAIAPLLPAQLSPGGIACIEVGAGQAAEVSALIEVQGLVVHIRHDLAGMERCLAARHRT